MWIEKVPRRWDFCGRVGCPLCYDHVQPAPVVALEVTKETPAPSFQEQMELVYQRTDNLPQNPREYELCHAYLAGEMKKEDEAREAKAKEEDDNAWLHRGLTAERKRRERVEEAGWKPLNTVTCDSIGGEKIEEQIKEDEKKKIISTPPEKKEGTRAFEQMVKDQQAFLKQQEEEERQRQMYINAVSSLLNPYRNTW